MANVEDLKRYYDSFLAFLDAVGAHQAILKMGINVEEGVYPVQKVAYDYGYTGDKLDMEIQCRSICSWKKLQTLNYYSQKVGYLPMNLDGMGKVLKFCQDPARRRWLRDNIRRAKDHEELLSIRDFMLKRFAWEKKKRERLGAGE